jgi:hypothetical protein
LRKSPFGVAEHDGPDHRVGFVDQEVAEAYRFGRDHLLELGGDLLEVPGRSDDFLLAEEDGDYFLL